MHLHIQSLYSALVLQSIEFHKQNSTFALAKSIFYPIKENPHPIFFILNSILISNNSIIET